LTVLMVAAGCAVASPNAPAADLVHQAIDSFNAGAGGPVTAQQSVLRQVVSSGQLGVQNRCPTPAVTIELEPVYARLTAAPDWRPASGTLPGVVYALPTLIRVYTGDRITGTDLTDLHLAIDGGRITFSALCLQ